MVYPIVIYGHPVLRKVAEDVEKDNPGLKQLINDLFETMYRSEGLGLAAPQIGKSLRVLSSTENLSQKKNRNLPTSKRFLSMPGLPKGQETSN